LECRRRYGCEAHAFAGSDDALYDRHLTFDNIAGPASTDARERFEAFARAVRDVLSKRWLKTDAVYAQRNPKRIYYLSMEFLIGRSLANNVTNLLLDPIVRQAIKDDNMDWVSLLEQEPDAGLGNGGLGRLAACFLDSMATMQLPAIGYGLRYEYGIFKQTIQDGWQQEHPDNWLFRPDPWEVTRPHEKVEVKLNCTLGIREGRMHAIAGRPSTLIGVPFDRPVVGYGGETVNKLRLWAASAPDGVYYGGASGNGTVYQLTNSNNASWSETVLYSFSGGSDGVSA
jgi:starch phosphorylase